MTYRLFTVAAAIIAMGGAAMPASAVAAEPTKYVNLKGGGVALHGYDAVAYFDRSAAVKGSPAYTASYQGIRYQFADAASKAKFEASPQRYLPVYGGFCAYGVAQG